MVVAGRADRRPELLPRVACVSTEADPGPAKVTLDPSKFIVRVPTLVLWGERDRALLTGCIDGLEQFVPDLKLVRVPDASHWIVHEKPELVCSEMEGFLRR